MRRGGSLSADIPLQCGEERHPVRTVSRSDNCGLRVYFTLLRQTQNLPESTRPQDFSLGIGEVILGIHGKERSEHAPSEGAFSFIGEAMPEVKGELRTGAAKPVISPPVAPGIHVYVYSCAAHGIPAARYPDRFRRRRILIASDCAGC